jgi:hypothetical protein
MSAFSVPSLSTASLAPSPNSRNLAGMAGRSTASVRTRYRRQTAILMLGTTVVGLWMALAAPSISPVAPVAPPAVFGAAGPVTGGSATDPTAPLRRNDRFAGDGLRGSYGFRGHRR